MTYPRPERPGIDGAIENFLVDIAEAARASNGFVLEMGVASGTGSTLAIHDGLVSHPDPLHVSVDLVDHMYWKPEVPWWHLVLADSRSVHAVKKVLTITSRTPGLIFIDTDHTYEQMAAELLLWSPIAGEDTVWLFHDTYMHGQYNHMTDAIREFAPQYGWKYDDFRTQTHGLGRMRRP